MIFLWLFYPLIEAVIQALVFAKQLHKYGQYVRPDYLQLNVTRGIVAITFASLVLEATPETSFFILLFQVGSFWLLFDPLLNKFMGRPLDYEGKDSGLTKGIPYWLQALISLMMITIALYFYL